MVRSREKRIRNAKMKSGKPEKMQHRLFRTVLHFVFPGIIQGRSLLRRE